MHSCSTSELPKEIVEMDSTRKWLTLLDLKSVDDVTYCNARSVSRGYDAYRQGASVNTALTLAYGSRNTRLVNTFFRNRAILLNWALVNDELSPKVLLEYCSPGRLVFAFYYMQGHDTLQQVECVLGETPSVLGLPVQLDTVKVGFVRNNSNGPILFLYSDVNTSDDLQHIVLQPLECFDIMSPSNSTGTNRQFVVLWDPLSAPILIIFSNDNNMSEVTRTKMSVSKAVFKGLNRQLKKFSRTVNILDGKNSSEVSLVITGQKGSCDQTIVQQADNGIDETPCTDSNSVFSN